MKKIAVPIILAGDDDLSTGAGTSAGVAVPVAGVAQRFDAG